MKQSIPTKEQVMDALATYKKIYKAADRFNVSAPTFSRWMKHYGIVANHNVKTESEPEQVAVAEPQHVPWYKRFIKKIH